MSMSQKTRGSTHVIIIIILVVALVGALGVVFYQNFVKKDEATTDTTAKTDTSAAKDTQASATKLISQSLSDGFGVALSFDYPSDWTFARTTTGPLPIVNQGDATDERMTITSPSGKFIVTYRVVSTDGFGGTCVPEETGTYVTASYQELSKFDDLSYFEFTTSSMPVADDGTHTTGGMVLIKTADAKLAVSGASVCETSFAGMIALNANGVTFVSPRVAISGVKTAEEFKAAAKGIEYEQAKAILLSAAH